LTQIEHAEDTGGRRKVDRRKIADERDYHDAGVERNWIKRTKKISGRLKRDSYQRCNHQQDIQQKK
jgi:hypothetical protein